MHPTRLFAAVSLVLLPTVMYGGYSLRSLMESPEGLTDFQQTYFRAGHAHAGVLLVLSLVYYRYLAETSVSRRSAWLACGCMLVGILAQSGGFFLHMAVGESGAASIGTWVTAVGAVLLAAAVLFLAYALLRFDPTPGSAPSPAGGNERVGAGTRTARR